MKNKNTKIYNNMYHTMFEGMFDEDEKKKTFEFTKNKSKINAIECTQRLVNDVLGNLDRYIDKN